MEFNLFSFFIGVASQIDASLQADGLTGSSSDKAHTHTATE